MTEILETLHNTLLNLIVLAALKRFVKTFSLTMLKFAVCVVTIWFCIDLMRSDVLSTHFFKLQETIARKKLAKEIQPLKLEIQDSSKQMAIKIRNDENIEELTAILKQKRQNLMEKEKEIMECENITKQKIAFERILRDMSSENPRIKRHAIAIISNLNAKYSLPYIQMCLFDPNPSVRRKAAKAVKSMAANIHPGIRQVAMMPGWLRGQDEEN